jgi:hypothetical protein
VISFSSSATRDSAEVVSADGSPEPRLRRNESSAASALSRELGLHVRELFGCLRGAPLDALLEVGAPDGVHDLRHAGGVVTLQTYGDRVRLALLLDAQLAADLVDDVLPLSPRHVELGPRPGEQARDLEDDSVALGARRRAAGGPLDEERAVTGGETVTALRKGGEQERDALERLGHLQSIDRDLLPAPGEAGEPEERDGETTSPVVARPGLTDEREVARPGLHLEVERVDDRPHHRARTEELDVPLGWLRLGGARALQPRVEAHDVLRPWVDLDEARGVVHRRREEQVGTGDEERYRHEAEQHPALLRHGAGIVGESRLHRARGRPAVDGRVALDRPRWRQPITAERIEMRQRFHGHLPESSRTFGARDTANDGDHEILIGG